MADNVNITPGAGATVATDEVVIGGVTVQVQRVQPILGKDGIYTADLAGRDLGGGDGALYSDPRNPIVRLSVTPTISNAVAYSAGDALGGLITFTGAARGSGFPVVLEALYLVDRQDVPPNTAAAIDVVFFNQTFTASVDNAVFAPSDTDLPNTTGVVTFATTDWRTFSVNGVATRTNLNHVMIPSGTANLFAQMVTRGTPTWTATTNLTLVAVFRQL